MAFWVGMTTRSNDVQLGVGPVDPELGSGYRFAEDVQLFEPDRFAIRWRIAGTANVPFPGLRIKPYIVTWQSTRCGHQIE